MLAVLVLLCLGVAWLRANLDAQLNRVTPVELPPPSVQALAVHASTFVADLHADSLLLGRDLLRRSDVGHVDLPRLQEGGVALQVFGGVTRVPAPVRMRGNAASAPDLLTLGGVFMDPGFARLRPFGRARLTAERLDGFVRRSGGALRWVRSRADLEALVAARSEGRGPIGALYALEGAHALEGDPARLVEAFGFGVRMIGLAHFFDNAFVGSAHGRERGGLTPLGRELVRGMQARGVVVDLAHVSPDGVRDVLALATRPVVFSHGGVRGTCDNDRNLSDAQLDALAENGGVVGIGYFDWAICGIDVEQLVAAIEHVIDRVGDTHVALGSDYDGTIEAGFDTSRLPSVTQALLDRGHAPERVRRVMGGNVLRVLRATLPAESPGVRPSDRP